MEGTFVVDEVSAIIKEAMETIIGGNVYQHSKVPQWTNTTVEHILGQLTKMNKPFKYIVTCVIMEKNGAGLHTATSCYWDNTTDEAELAYTVGGQACEVSSIHSRPDEKSMAKLDSSASHCSSMNNTEEQWEALLSSSAIVDQRWLVQRVEMMARASGALE